MGEVRRVVGAKSRGGQYRDMIVHYGELFWRKQSSQPWYCALLWGCKGVVILESASANDERVWVEKVEKEAPSCFWIGCVCLRVWCSVLQLVVWARVTDSWRDLCECMVEVVFEGRSRPAVEVPCVYVTERTLCPFFWGGRYSAYLQFSPFEISVATQDNDLPD